jgi:hypothetical protein
LLESGFQSKMLAGLRIAASGRRSSLMPHGGAMIEIVRTNDLVTISAIEALLKAADIHALVADSYISALEGGIGAFQRRILVLREDEAEARALIDEAGLGAELRP